MWSMTDGRKGFGDQFKVLLVESDERSRQHHAYILIQSSYTVQSTTELSEALSLITYGNTYDCLLVDVQIPSIDMVLFLQTVWKHNSKLPIVVMTSDRTHLAFAIDSLADGSITFLEKPCSVTTICNTLQKLYRKKFSFGESQYIVPKVSTIQSSTNFNFTMSYYNNTSSSYNGAIRKPVAYINISSDDDNDDETITRKNNQDKGKKPRGIKIKGKKNHIKWTRELHELFLEAVTALGKEGATPAAIVKHMNVPGLTRDHISSHVQKWKEKEMKKQNDLQVKSYKLKSFLQSSVLNRVSLPDQITSTNYNNSSGISHMSIDNIKARCLERGPQYLPFSPQDHQTKTTITNSQEFVMQRRLSTGENFMSGFGLSHQEKTGHTKGTPPLQPAILGCDFGITDQNLQGDSSSRIDSVLQTDGDVLSNGFDGTNFVDTGSSAAAVSEDLALFDGFGIPILESTVGDSDLQSLLNFDFDDPLSPEFISHDQGTVLHHAQEDFDKGNRENSIEQVINADEGIQHAPGNSTVPRSGSDGELYMDINEWFLSEQVINAGEEIQHEPWNSIVPTSGSGGELYIEDLWFSS